MERTRTEPRWGTSPAMGGGSALPDGELVRRVVAGDRASFEMHRHDTPVYHAIRSILRDEAEVEGRDPADVPPRVRPPAMSEDLARETSRAFPFLAPRCDRVVARVMAALPPE